MNKSTSLSAVVVYLLCLLLLEAAPINKKKNKGNNRSVKKFITDPTTPPPSPTRPTRPTRPTPPARPTRPAKCPEMQVGGAGGCDQCGSCGCCGGCPNCPGNFPPCPTDFPTITDDCQKKLHKKVEEEENSDKRHEDPMIGRIENNPNKQKPRDVIEGSSDKRIDIPGSKEGIPKSNITSKTGNSTESRKRDFMNEVLQTTLYDHDHHPDKWTDFFHNDAQWDRYMSPQLHHPEHVQLHENNYKVRLGFDLLHDKSNQIAEEQTQHVEAYPGEIVSGENYLSKFIAPPVFEEETEHNGEEERENLRGNDCKKRDCVSPNRKSHRDSTTKESRTEAENTKELLETLNGFMTPIKNYNNGFDGKETNHRNDHAKLESRFQERENNRNGRYQDRNDKNEKYLERNKESSSYRGNQNSRPEVRDDDENDNEDSRFWREHQDITFQGREENNMGNFNEEENRSQKQYYNKNAGDRYETQGIRIEKENEPSFLSMKPSFSDEQEKEDFRGENERQNRLPEQARFNDKESSNWREEKQKTNNEQINENFMDNRDQRKYFTGESTNRENEEIEREVESNEDGDYEDRHFEDDGEDHFEEEHTDGEQPNQNFRENDREGDSEEDENQPDEEIKYREEENKGERDGPEYGENNRNDQLESNREESGSTKTIEDKTAKLLKVLDQLKRKSKVETKRTSRKNSTRTVA